MQSEIKQVGRVSFPEFTGTRWMMMPIVLEDDGTVPWPYRGLVGDLVRLSTVKRGIAYLTVDECDLKAGEHHRRPGLHVDGIGEDGRSAAYGGGGGYGGNGMLLVSSHVGCRGWAQSFEGWPGPNGDCAHLGAELRADAEIVMQPERVYWCSPLAVHESVPMAEDCRRQFVRLSMPSEAPWHEGYTPSPYGVLPTGPIHGRREQMGWRR